MILGITPGCYAGARLRLLNIVSFLVIFVVLNMSPEYDIRVDIYCSGVVLLRRSKGQGLFLSFEATALESPKKSR